MRREFAAILAVLQEISAARTELAQGTEAKIRAQNFRKAPRQRDRSLRKEPQFNCAVLPPAKEVNPMDIQVNDILTMKKQHPCGSKQWQVLRIGMDFRLKCLGCGHEVMLPRSKAEKNIRTVEREGEIVC